MATLILPIGISGSGKSYIQNKLKDHIENYEIISPEDIRREITGSQKDFSKTKKVCEVQQEKTREAIKNNLIVFDTSMNIFGGKKGIVRAIQDYRSIDPNLKIVIVFFEDSEDLALCSQRVKKDEAEKIDRQVASKDDFKYQHEYFMKLRKDYWLYETSQYGLKIVYYKDNPYIFKQLVDIING